MPCHVSFSYFVLSNVICLYLVFQISWNYNTFCFILLLDNIIRNNGVLFNVPYVNVGGTNNTVTSNTVLNDALIFMLWLLFGSQIFRYCNDT